MIYITQRKRRTKNQKREKNRSSEIKSPKQARLKLCEEESKNHANDSSRGGDDAIRPKYGTAYKALERIARGGSLSYLHVSCEYKNPWAPGENNAYLGES